MRRLVFNMRDERPVWAPPSWVLERLRDALPDDVELIDVNAPVSGRGDGGGLSEEALRAVRGAEVYFGLGLPRELLRAALEPPARLRWIHTGAAGVASLLHVELVESDVILTNSAGIHAEPIAETVLGMMLYFARGLDHAVRAQAQRRWSTVPFEAVDSGVREIEGAALGIVGYGGIGRAIARRGAALGMQIRAVRSQRQDEELDDVVSSSDFVVLSVPSTPRTRGMIGARELELMKQDAVLINVARGDVIDEDALVDALRSGHLRGAALDVFRTEPLPPDSPLWEFDNVLITPHTSATSPRFWEREAELLLDNLRSYLAGKPLHNVVDTTAGY